MERLGTGRRGGHSRSGYWRASLPRAGETAPDADPDHRIGLDRIIGGLGSVPGAILGAIYVVGIPRMFPGSDIAPLLATGLGLLLVLMIRPGGLWSLLMGLRDSWVWGLTVEDRAFKGPLSHIVPPDVPESARLGSMFEEAADDGPSSGYATGAGATGAGATGGPNGDGRRRQERQKDAQPR